MAYKLLAGKKGHYAQKKCSISIYYIEIGKISQPFPQAPAGKEVGSSKKSSNNGQYISPETDEKTIKITYADNDTA